MQQTKPRHCNLDAANMRYALDAARALRVGLAGLVLLLVATPHWTRAQPEKALAEKSATFEVRLPAEAKLEIDEQKTVSTGPVRLFESPPLAVGKNYIYTLKATCAGREITKQVTVTPGRQIVVDLEPDFKLPPKPAGTFTLQAFPAVKLKPGETGNALCRISRDNFTESVALVFSGVPKGVTIAPATVRGDKDSVEVAIRVASDAIPQTSAVKLQATGGNIQRVTMVNLTIDKADKSPENPVLKPPEKPSPLWQRLGGEENVKRIVDDYVSAIAKDPKVNFDRDGKYRLDAEAVDGLKRQMLHYISATSDGPFKYSGKSMKEAHKGMGVTEAEFEALLANFKNALEKNGIKPADVEILLKAVTATRKEIVVMKRQHEKKPDQKEPH